VHTYWLLQYNANSLLQNVYPFKHFLTWASTGFC